MNKVIDCKKTTPYFFSFHLRDISVYPGILVNLHANIG